MTARDHEAEILVRMNFHGFTANPQEVALRSGITPTEIWFAGDPIGRTGRKHASNGWRIAAPGQVLNVDIATAVDALYSMLAPEWTALLEVSSHCRVELSVVIYAASHMPAIHFRSDQIERLAQISGKIDVDAHCFARS